MEPLNTLFKDEVPEVGPCVWNCPRNYRETPFPGPGLEIRILGDVTRLRKVKTLQEVDYIFYPRIKKIMAFTIRFLGQAGKRFCFPSNRLVVMGDEP